MIDMVTRRKGELTSMETQGDRVNIAFNIPSRGIIGLRTNVLTASAGEAIMAHRFKGYEPYKGDIDRRTNGSMIAMESGTALPMLSISCRTAVSSSSIRRMRYTQVR
jgi:GTP-binding protein